ncbi:TPA: TonB-dependent receptor [Campylobacter fetus subsp. venerealis]|nr:TonB-dependent receptor [Campylobacter fetus subsp. venerealis]HDX6310044.1 TonB-dependent receptor [Campylobacter fetus subsp. venerealis]HDX6320023.1 TonB-dependent receptor [Campylobacter fetus subsp. venerealis]HDX6321616.1 TonB-dependent receptor [Campylobacter fetus subsp. venerealis]HDX8134407.1 TonB-dependent receptor [Campylobacter fetus subsp. venerealis]
MKKAFILSCALSSVLFGADGVYDLGRIEVTTPNQKQTIAEGSDAVVTQKEIAESLSTSVDQAIRNTPGVYTTPYALGSRGEADIGIRGFGRTQIGLFIDGIPVNSIYDRQTDWSQFNTYDVSQIDVAKGFVSPIYGINSMGGAVNIISTKPTKELEAGLKYGLLSGKENQIGANVGTNQGNWYSSFSYSLVDRDSFPLSNDYKPTDYQPGDKARNSYYKNQTFKAKVGFEPSEGSEYSLNAVIQRGEKGGTVNANGNGRFWDWPNYDKNTVYFLGQTQINDKWSLNSKIYWDNFYNVLHMKGGVGKNGTITPAGFRGVSIYDDHSFGLIETAKYQIDDTKELQFGANLRYNHTNNDNYNFVDANKGNFSQGNFTDADEYKDFQTSLFVQFGHQLNDTWRYVVSAGYDRVDTITAIRKRSDTSDGKLDYEVDLWDWNAQTIFFADWDNANTTHFNIGKKNNLPTLKTRYGTPWGARIPNPNLDTESIYNTEIGHKFDNGSTMLGATAFYNILKNSIITVNGLKGCDNPDKKNGCSMLDNANGGYSYGLELSAEQRLFNDRVNIGANYTYTQKHTSADSNNGIALNKIQDYPNHIANAFISYSPVKQVDLVLSGTYRSAQWTYDEMTGYENQNDDVFLMDLKANFRPYKSLELSVGATNLLDENYQYNGGYYMAGRRFFVTAEYKY